MKKKLFSLLPLLLLAVFFTACSKDENETPTLTGDLVGKWEIISKHNYDANDQKTSSSDHKHECSATKDYYEFKKNSKGAETQHNPDCSSYKYQDFKIIKENGTYYVVNTEDSDLTYEVVSLSKNSLTLQCTHQFGYFLLYFDRLK
jgi:hypothetical protein